MSAELAIIARLQDEASSGIRALRGEVEGLEPSAGIAAQGFASLQAVGAAALTALAAAAVAVGAAIVGSIGAASEFEDSVTILSIAAQGAGESFDSMRAAAMAVGADTSLVGVNAAGAAEAMTILYKAGMTTGEVFGDLNGYLAGNVELNGALRAAIDGAAASELSMEQAAMLAATSLATFGSEMMTTSERADFVNTAMNNFVQTADASMASVADLAAAMQNIGPTAAQFGISLQDTNTALALLSTRGVMGAEAGTALKSMFNNLLTPTAEASAALNQLGVNIYNTDGTMREMPAIVADLSQALYGLNATTVITGGRTAEQNHQLELAQRAYDQATDAIYKHNAGLKTLTDSQLQKYVDQQSAANAEIQRLGSITGTATTAMSQLTEEQRNYYIELLAGSYGMKAFSILLQEGADGWTAMEKAIASAATIQEVAAARTQTFSGAMEALSGVVETIRIGIGSAFLPVLTALARVFADLAAGALPYIVGAFEALGGALSMFFDAVMNGTNPITAFADAVGQLAEALGMPAEQAALLRDQIEGVLTAISNVVGPIVQAITSFVSWKDVLLAVGIAIGSVVLPVLIGIVQAVAPVIAVFAALVLAIAALRTAFETNFLGIRDLALGVWAALQQVFEGIRALLSGDTTTAMAAFRSAWEAGWSAIAGFVQNAGSQIGQALAGLWGSIVAWFQGIDWGALAQSLIDRFFAGMASLGQAAAGSWEWLLTSITNFITGTDWGALGHTLIDLLISGIIGAVGLIGTAIGGIVTFIWNFITGTDWIALGTNLVNAIIDGLRTFGEGAGEALGEWRQRIFDWAGAEDWGGVGDKIAEMVGDALGTAKEAVATKLTEWKTAIFDWAGAEDWQGVAQHIAEMIGEKLGEMGEAISGQLTEWQTAIFDWAGAEDWEGVATHIAEMIGEKLGEMGETISAQLSEWQTAIFDWAGAEDWSGVAEHIAEMIGQALADAATTLWNGLESWEQAIFDWAGAADWVGVGLHIAEMIGQALADAAGLISDKLGEWEQAIFDWVGATSWIEVGQTIVEMAVEGLTEWASAAADKVDEWFGDMTAAIEGIDWYQIGYDISNFIVTGLIEFGNLVSEKITGWYTSIQTFVEGKSWTEIAAIILGAIALGLGEFADKAGTAVSTWKSDISAKITEMIGAFSELGGNIVDGIISGITAMAGAVAEAIRGIIAGALGAGEQAAGAQSPARAFMPLGSDISAGVAVGMVQGIGTVVDAIGQLASAIEVEGAKAFGEAMKALAEGLAAGMNAILDLSAFPGVGGSFLDNLRTVVDMLGQMVVEVAQANVYGEEALGLLGTFVDVAGGIADLILPLITALIEIGRFQPPSAETFTAALAQLALYLSMTVQHVVAANQYSTLVLEGLSAFLGVMEQIADTVGPFLAALVDINAFGTVRLDFFHEGIAHLWYTMLMLVGKVQELAVLGTETLARMEGFLEVVQAIADLVGPFIEALYEMNAFGTVDLNFFHEGLAQLAYVMLMVVGALNEANTFGTAALEAVRLFAETAGAIADMIGPMIEGLISINALDGTMNEVAYHAVYFRNGVRALVDALASAAQLFTSGTLQHVQLFAETAGAIAEIIVPAVEGLMIIGTLTGDLNYIGIQATYFRNGLRTIVSALESAAELFTAAILNQIQLFAETAGKIMEIVAAAIEGFALISTLTGEVNYLGIQATYLRNGLRIIVSAISSAAELFTAGLLAHTQLFAETAGTIVELIADAIEALALLATYVAAAGLEAAAMAFAVSLTTVVLTIVNALEAAGLLASEAIVKAGELADGLGDVLGLVEDGVEALVALASYVPAANLVPTAQQFAADLATVITTVVNALQLAGILASTAIVAAGELADGLADVLGMVEDGVSALVELANYVPNAGLVALAQRFAIDLATVITAVVNALVQAGLLANQAVVEAGELADGLADILSVVADGVEAITALTAYVAASGIQEKAAAFAADLATVINAIVNGLVTAGLLANQAVAAAGELAGKLSDLLGVVGDGIEAIQALAEYQGVDGLKDKVQIFTSDLIAVATLLATQLTLAANTIGAATIDAARAFAAAVTALATEVQAAMTALGQLAGMATPNITAILTYIVASAQQIQQSFAAAGDIGQAVAYAAAFRANLEQLVQEVQAAAAQLNALAGVGTTGSIGAALANIAASLQNTEGQFTGAGTALAQALIAAMTAGVNGGQGEVQGATLSVLDATRNAGESAANGFSSVGDAIIDAIARAVESGQGQVIAAVTQVVNAAIAAGVAAARAADSIGNQLIQATLTEVNNGRGQLDSAGSAAGSALIDGMARAITAGRSRVVNAIIDTVRAAIAAAQNALGISSPSRVAIELLSNFMNTAANTVDSLRGRLADSVAAAVAGAAAAATANMNAIRLAPQLTPALAFPGSALADRVAAAPAGRAGGRWAGSESGGSTQVVFYGNVVLPNVVDSRSFLEELDALRGAA